MPKNTIIPAAGGPGLVPPVPEQGIRFDRTRGTDLRGYTPGAGGENDRWVMSWWQKITGDLGVNRVMWEARLDANNYTRFEMDASNRFHFEAAVAGVIEATFTSKRVMVDVSNWHHCHMRFDRLGGFLQFSINGYGYPGIQQVPVSVIANIAGYVWMTSVEHFIGGDALSADRYSGYINEMHCVPAGVLPAVTAFGVFNSKGVWERIVYAGAHGANGFYLTFGRTVDLGEDFSGNFNDFTVHTNGAASDQVDDWMEKNYCILDVNDARTTGTVDDGALDVAGGNAAVTMRPDFGVWYYEVDGVATVWDTGVSGQFDPIIAGPASVNFGQLPFVDVGPMGGEMTVNSNNFPTTTTDIARDYVASIQWNGNATDPRIIDTGEGQSTIYDTEYADLVHRADLVWAKKAGPGGTNWYQAHRLRAGAQLPINTTGVEETVNANGVITDLPDPGPGFEVTDGATDNDNFNEFGNVYNCLSLHSKNYSQNIPTAVDSDDAEEQVNGGGFPGSVTISSSDLELNSESNSAGTEQQVGMRFLNVQIPQGSTIIDARIQFEADENQAGVGDMEIFCQDADDTVTFVSANGNISSRPKTTASTLWSPADWSVQDRLAAQLTPNFATSVQEVVDRGGWAPGNSMVVVVAHDQASANFNRRTAEGAGSGTPVDAHEPMLHLTWRRPGAEAESGVSLFTYTGVGKVADVMHGNPNAPDLIAVRRADVGADMTAYIGTVVTAGAPEDGRFRMNKTDGYEVSASSWNNTVPGGTFVTLGTSGRVNAEGGDYVGFALSNVPGFLKVFRYVGNGSVNGPEVYLGFKLRFLVVRRADAIENWMTLMKVTDIIAAENNQFNESNHWGFLNTTDNFYEAPTGGPKIQVYSSGFKLVDTRTDVNANLGEYVGFAFAEAALQNAKATN